MIFIESQSVPLSDLGSTELSYASTLFFGTTQKLASDDKMGADEAGRQQALVYDVEVLPRWN